MSKLDKFLERKQFRIFETKNWSIYKYLLLDINGLVEKAHKEFILDREEFDSSKGKFEVYKKVEKNFLINCISHWLVVNRDRIVGVQYDDDDDSQKAYEEILNENGAYDVDPPFIYWQLKRYSIIRESKIAGKIELTLPLETMIFIRALIEMNEETRSEYKAQMVMLNEVYENIRSKCFVQEKFSYEDWYQFNTLLNAYNSNLKSVRTVLGEAFEQIMEDPSLDVIVALKNFRINILDSVIKIFDEGTEGVAKGFAKKIEEDEIFEGYWLNDGTFWYKGSVSDFENGELNSIAYDFALITQKNALAVQKREIKDYIKEVADDLNSVVGRLVDAQAKIAEIRSQIGVFINYIIEYEQRNKLTSAVSIGNILNNILIRLQENDYSFEIPTIENKNYSYENSYIPSIKTKKEKMVYKQPSLPKMTDFEKKTIKEKLIKEINVNADEKIVFNKFLIRYLDGVSFTDIELKSIEDFGFSQALVIFSSEKTCPYGFVVNKNARIQRKIEEDNITYDVKFKDDIKFAKRGK